MKQRQLARDDPQDHEPRMHSLASHAVAVERDDETDHLRDRLDGELSHEIRPVTLDGLLAYPEQRRDLLVGVAVDHQVTVRWPGGHHDDGRLLTAVGQRGQQSALPLRLTDSQMFPPPVQLVKLQLHGRLLGIQYAGGWNWSFSGEGEVCWEVSLPQ